MSSIVTIDSNGLYISQQYYDQAMRLEDNQQAVEWFQNLPKEMVNSKMVVIGMKTF